METAVEGAFEGFTHSRTHNPFLGVEPMGESCIMPYMLRIYIYNNSHTHCCTSALDDSKSGFHGEERVVQSYEDLVRNYVVSCMYILVAMYVCPWSSKKTICYFVLRKLVSIIVMSVCLVLNYTS